MEDVIKLYLLLLILPAQVTYIDIELLSSPNISYNVVLKTHKILQFTANIKCWPDILQNIFLFYRWNTVI